MKKVKKSEKIFSATAQLADALAGRIQFPDAISGGFFPSFSYARNCVFFVGPASDRRRRGIGQASDRFPPDLKKSIFQNFCQILKEKNEKNEKKAKNFLCDRSAR